MVIEEYFNTLILLNKIQNTPFHSTELNNGKGDISNIKYAVTLIKFEWFCDSAPMLNVIGF